MDTVTSVFHCARNRISVGMRFDGGEIFFSFAAQCKDDVFNRRRAYDTCMVRLDRRPHSIGYWTGNPHAAFRIIRDYIRDLKPNRQVNDLARKVRIHLNNTLPF